MDVGNPVRDRAPTIRTAHLELVPITERMLDALLEGDTPAVAREVGGEVSRWLARNTEHVVQVGRIAHAAQAPGTGWTVPEPGRLVVLARDGRRRRAIGSVGFHGPPDDQGRLVIGCSIAPSHRGRGLAAEALRAMIDWTARNHGIDAFLFHVSAAVEGWERDAADLPIEGAGGGLAGTPALPALAILPDPDASRWER